jgi:hypothetical protein
MHQMSNEAEETNWINNPIIENSKHLEFMTHKFIIRKRCEDFFKMYLEEENVNLDCEHSTNGCWKKCVRCKEHFKH